LDLVWPEACSRGETHGNLQASDVEETGGLHTVIYASHAYIRLDGASNGRDKVIDQGLMKKDEGGGRSTSCSLAGD
jgi:hypothetical protein